MPQSTPVLLDGLKPVQNYTGKGLPNDTEEGYYYSQP